ncbi:hypothetical protein HMN09_00743800 [Mycena chlorophos]|uniref:DUF5648 domain-containing protein n=1 Tax=Mycena chlorophos TaxID=658473 RepID=A0A8H6W7K4_MYCCL|nr:hypothetical protein HMN09_00743800 [Mycena chlorophos]
MKVSTTLCGLVASVVVVASQSCTDCGSSITPLFRMFSVNTVDHFYTNGASEVIAAATDDDYGLEGVASGVFPSQQGCSVQFLRLNNPTVFDHFYTINTNEAAIFEQNGYTLEGNAGYINASPNCSTVTIPLLRFFNPAAIDHFYTTSEEEGQAFTSQGYVSQGIAGYVPLPGVIVNQDLC